MKEKDAMVLKKHLMELFELHHSMEMFHENITDVKLRMYVSEDNFSIVITSEK